MSVILLWSQFSGECLKILDDAKRIQGIKFLCIDNPQIRHKILNSQKVKVLSVPCILQHKNSQLFQFEGTQAVQFIQMYSRNEQPQQIPQQIQQQIPQQIQQFQPQQFQPQQFQPQQFQQPRYQPTPHQFQSQQIPQQPQEQVENNGISFTMSGGPLKKQQEDRIKREEMIEENEPYSEADPRGAEQKTAVEFLEPEPPVSNAPLQQIQQQIQQQQGIAQQHYVEQTTQPMPKRRLTKQEETKRIMEIAKLEAERREREILEEEQVKMF